MAQMASARNAAVFFLVPPVALLSLGGCAPRGELLGSIDADGAAAPPGDARADGAAIAPPRFAPPQAVIALSDPDSIDEDPTFTGDLLELYFMSNRNGTKDIWSSRRAAAGDPWGAPSLVSELSSTAIEYAPAIAIDGLHIWFATDRDMARGRIWQSSRASRADPWTAPVPVSELASGSIDFAPAVDDATTTLFFCSNRPGSSGGSYDIYWTTRASPSGTWGAAAPAPGAVNSASDEYDPFIGGGGLVLFFTSMRSGMGDIYWTARPSIDQPFQAPVVLTDLDSAAYDSDSTLSSDLTYMMFSSTRSGNAEIYETRALP
jgi:hypothetical protein